MISRVGYYHLEANELKSLGAGMLSDRIRYHGEGLPDFIAWAKSTSEGVPVYDALLEEMKELLPHLDTIIVTQAKAGEQGIAFRFRSHRGFINASELSDGTLHTLGLLCVTHAARKHGLVCIEEPETGFHPGRLRWLFDHLVTLAYPKAGEQPVQVILTSHSPYLVNFFKDMHDAVQIVEHKDGHTRVKPLTDILSELHIKEPSASIGDEWAMGLYEGL
jgi:predicted ATPase